MWKAWETQRSEPQEFFLSVVTPDPESRLLWSGDRPKGMVIPGAANFFKLYFMEMWAHSRLEDKIEASEMAHSLKGLAAKPENLGSIPGIHGRGENQILDAVL